MDKSALITVEPIDIKGANRTQKPLEKYKGVEIFLDNETTAK